MKRIWIFVLFAASAVFFSGCQKPAMSGQSDAITDPSIPTHAQPRLATVKLWIGSEEMITEMAVTEMQERTGMMFRTNMAENEGMIFAFPRPQRVSFWMMNTILPLSAAYISPEGEILEIHDLQPHDTNSVVAGTENVQFVLETRQGWFKRHNIKEGTSISTEKGSLQKVLMGR